MDIMAALASAGLACSFTTASIDGRAPFDSSQTITISPTNRTNIYFLQVEQERDRVVRLSRSGVWVTLTGDEALTTGRYSVLDVGPNGRATFVTRQRNAAAKIISRDGTCRDINE